MMPQMDGSIFGWTAGADLLPGDPLGRLLLRNRSPLQVAACAVALSVLCNAVALTVALKTVPLGSLLPKDPTRPYALMISVFTYDFVVAPLIWAFYAWVSRAPLSLLNELTSRRLFIEPTPGFVRGGLFGAQGYIDSSYSHRRWFWSGLAIAIILGVLGILYPPFHNTPAIKLYSQLKMIVVVPVCFMLWMVLSRIVATIKVLDLLFRHSDLQLNPLHPDRCGGLGPLNRYAQALTRFIATIGVGLVVVAVPRVQAESISQQPLLQIAIVSYLVLAPYCFFATLGTAHRAMLKARSEWLLQISDRFLARYGETLKELKDNGEISEAKLAGLQRLSRLHEITEAFPVWPFDAASIQRFAAAFLAPAAGVPLATAAAKLVEQILKQFPIPGSR